MYTTNPYAQGWSSGSSNPPSVLGALPFSGASSAGAGANILTFRFTSLNPDILNCTVTGPHSQPYFRVVTDNNNTRKVSYFQNANGKVVGSITWSSHPQAEVMDIVPRQAVGQWMGLSPDGRARQMECAGKRYIWSPNNKALCLYTSHASPALLARISRARDGTVELEISSNAIQESLLEVCIVATVLLQCGRNID